MKQKMPAFTLTYFRENPPFAMEEVSIEQPSEAIMAFANAALEVIGKALARHAFTRTQTRIDATSVTLSYRRAAQWVRVEASTDYRDSPAYFNVILGTDGPGIAMTVALWRVVRLTPGLEQAGEYPFPIGESMYQAMEKAASDLKTHGKGFLQRDFSQIREAWDRMLKEINH